MTEKHEQIPLQIILSDVSVANEESSSSIFVTIWHGVHEHSGIWYMLTGNFIFSCCTFALKLIPADMFDIMIMRFLIQSVVFGLYATFYKKYNLFNTNGQPLACAMNIFMSSGTNLTYLAAFYFLPLSDLNAIKYTYIVWAAILSIIFFKDRFKLINAFALILTITGLILATKSQALLKIFNHLLDRSILNSTILNSSTTIISSTVTISSYYYLGITLAFISSLTKATQMIARKQLVKTKQPHSVMNFHFTAFALIAALIYSIARRFWQPEPYPWKLMLTFGVAIGLCHLVTNAFYAKALKRESLQLLSILGALDIVHACILQYIFLQLTRPFIFYIGATLIALSAVILSVDSYVTTKK
ncbi:unnamed protein product [Rotaria magnacalcarata]|uniref:EamA domain-containing protein n=1 Tax=Rotaria magnacalcarata TaxID=392030 RepID=A0A818YLM8_9BILA|nr:unnamed protein product [Rotaria magnacalcarata]CAF3752681.1 unnamed protein product [Rotaria magnacalcarata]